MFTSESVGEGHPDKICDCVSDAVLDAHLEQDPDARVACETFSKTGMVKVGGDLGEIYSAHLYMKSTQSLEVYDRMGNELIYDTEPRLCEEIVTIIRQRNGILPQILPKTWNR